jgi:hypothetical protein
VRREVRGFPGRCYIRAAMVIKVPKRSLGDRFVPEYNLGTRETRVEPFINLQMQFTETKICRYIAVINLGVSRNLLIIKAITRLL